MPTDVSGDKRSRKRALSGALIRPPELKLALSVPLSVPLSVIRSTITLHLGAFRCSFRIRAGGEPEHIAGVCRRWHSRSTRNWAGRCGRVGWAVISEALASPLSHLTLDGGRSHVVGGCCIGRGFPQIFHFPSPFPTFVPACAPGCRASWDEALATRRRGDVEAKDSSRPRRDGRSRSGTHRPSIQPRGSNPTLFGFFWIACAWSAARLAMRVYESEADYSPMAARETAAATAQLLTLARDRFRSCRPALQLSKLQGIQSQSQSKVQLGFTSRHRASAHESHHHAWRHSGKSHASLRMSLVLLARPARHGGTAIACDVLRFIRVI